MTTEVMDAARSGEPEHYLAALLAPQDARDDLIAIAAFSAELARISTAVKEPMMGEIRLQWWRDRIDAAAGGNVDHGHAVADALARAIERRRFAVPRLFAMTEARAFDLYADAMPDDASFRGYLDKTSGATFALAAQTVGADVPAKVIDHAGRAFGRVRLLATLPRQLVRGRCPLPVALMTAVDCAPEDLLAGHYSQGARRLLNQLAADTLGDLAAAEDALAGLPRAQRGVFLPLATIRPYLARLQRDGHDPIRTMSEITPLARTARIARAHWFGL